jgi:hypothetical protein
MKKKIVLIIVAVLVAVSGVVVGVRVSPYKIYESYIQDVQIQVQEVSKCPFMGNGRPGYWVRVVAGGPNTCWKPWRYWVTRLGNTVFVKVLSRIDFRVACGQAFTWEEKDIGLGGCFFPGMKYKVVVNGVVETFIAE